MLKNLAFSYSFLHFLTNFVFGKHKELKDSEVGQLYY